MRGLAHLAFELLDLAREIEKLESQMRKAAHMMEYEYAAVLRDEIIRLRAEAEKK